MFGKKKPVPQIDKDQFELIKNAQQRIKQKRRLYIHFVVFLIGAIFLIVLNKVLGVGEMTKIFEIDWFVFAILVWLFLFLYHLFNVFVTHKFMGKVWEQQQMNKLVAKQKERVAQLEANVTSQEPFVSPSTSIEEKKISVINGMTIIAAVAENDAIGKDNQLLWHLGADLQRFKTLTSGHCIIMGRKTFESFSKPLPNRTHIVITRQPNYKVPPGVIVVDNLEDAIDAAKNDPQPFIIGGGEIYKQAMPYADKIELTRVHGSFDGDTYFPKIDMSVWKEVNKNFHSKDDQNEFEFTFITYFRR